MDAIEENATTLRPYLNNPYVLWYPGEDYSFLLPLFYAGLLHRYILRGSPVVEVRLMEHHRSLAIAVLAVQGTPQRETSLRQLLLSKLLEGRDGRVVHPIYSKHIYEHPGVQAFLKRA